MIKNFGKHYIRRCRSVECKSNFEIIIFFVFLSIKRCCVWLYCHIAFSFVWLFVWLAGKAKQMAIRNRKMNKRKSSQHRLKERMIVARQKKAKWDENSSSSERIVHGSNVCCPFVVIRP